ncbi:hypothetical protein KEM09_13815 [Carboxylicivirga mesophila]|uniref:Holin of 3TMs, for gene-transfer release n=1 Tax=Carboxylicivirga mesophila TaxID=1166478 RepID=A0ABS5KBS6_9BACT|nr:hypothetical protein [Carboxylicivirga mesophila]MBS2212488.1 hypothetical protein [Carboxylicivirga mesophila]
MKESDKFDILNLVDEFTASDAEKEKMKRLLSEAIYEQELEDQLKECEAKEELLERIRELEGTTADLKQAGWWGRFILFLRGAQRPIWGFAVLILDILVFTCPTLHGLLKNPDLMTVFKVINFLVLGFLFGERALKNVIPLVSQMNASRRESQQVTKDQPKG